MKISFIRGAYFNNFEGQNYPYEITGYSSLIPIDRRVSFPVIRLPSIADLQTIPFLQKPIKYITNRTLGDSQILFGLEKYIMNSDIVHIADPHYFYSYQAAQLKSKKMIKKFVSTWWETIPFNNESTYAKKRIKKYTMDNVEIFVCHSEKAKNCLLQENIPLEKIKLIRLGVDLSVFKQKISSQSNAFTILFVGRLVEEKGILDLYEAFKRITCNVQRVTLKIVGTGSLENSLNDHIQKDGLCDRVTIEQKTYKEMPAVYQEADILCVPSKKTKTWEEQYGMVFIESMASGLPIVSYNTGAISEVIGDAGLLTSKNTVNELTTLIIQIMRAKGLCVKLGTIGRERAEKFFDAETTKKSIFNLYKSLTVI